MTPTRTASLYTIATLALASLAVRADIIPTAPWGSVVDREGSPCEIQWNLDTTGEWTNFTIYLNSGSNQAFEQMTTVATGLDGTTGDGKYSWTCPEVTPNAQIYFYSFANNGGAPTTWTTRFTIADASGNTVQPPQATQPDGSATPWGVGTIAGGNSGAGSGSSGSGSSSSAAAGASSVAQSSAASSSSAATLIAPTTTMIRSTTTAISSAVSSAPSSAQDTADTTVITVSPATSRTTPVRSSSTGVINNQANNGTTTGTTTGGATASAQGSVAGLGLALALLAGFVVA